MPTFDAPPAETSSRSRSAARRARRQRVSVIGVVGEIFFTAGVVVVLYVVWQMWIGDLIYGAQASAEGRSVSEEWQRQYEQEPATEAPVPDFAAEPAAVDPPLLDRPADAQPFALMRIPRFGPDYFFDIAGGTTRARTLDQTRIGHYTEAAMPGQVGNFALAGHRTTFGGPFGRIAELRLGDAIIVEAPGGWYTYRFRTLEYVEPSEVDVLLDVPQKPAVPAGDRYITLTSCSPKGSLSERIIAYGLFESYTPRSAGPPAALTAPPS